MRNWIPKSWAELRNDNMLNSSLGRSISIIDRLMKMYYNHALEDFGIGWGQQFYVEYLYDHPGASAHYASYFFRKPTQLSIRLRDFRPTARLTWEIISIGLPSAATSLLSTVANVLMNRTLVAYSNNAVAGMGVAMKINTVAVYILLGLGTGIQPLIGYNYGSGNKKRLMDIFKFSSIASVIVGTVITAVMVILRTPLIQAFINDQEVIDYGTNMLVALQLAGPILGLVFIGANTIQAMGKALAAFILNLLRQGIFLIPLIFALNHFFGLRGVVYSNPIADYLAVVVSYIVCIKYMKQMGKESYDPE